MKNTRRKWLPLLVFAPVLIAFLILYPRFSSPSESIDPMYQNLIGKDYEVLGVSEHIEKIEYEKAPEESDDTIVAIPEGETVEETETPTVTIPEDEEPIDGDSITDQTIEKTPEPIVEVQKRKILTVDIYSENEITDDDAEALAKKLEDKTDFYTLILHVFAEKDKYKKAVEADYNGQYGLYHTTIYTPFYQEFSHHNYIDTTLVSESQLDALEYSVFDIVEDGKNQIIRMTANGDALDASIFVGAFIDEVKQLNKGIEDVTIEFYADQFEAENGIMPYWTYKGGMLQYKKDDYKMPQSKLEMYEGNQ